MNEVKFWAASSFIIFTVITSSFFHSLVLSFQRRKYFAWSPIVQTKHAMQINTEKRWRTAKKFNLSSWYLHTIYLFLTQVVEKENADLQFTVALFNNSAFSGILHKTPCSLASWFWNVKNEKWCVILFYSLSVKVLKLRRHMHQQRQLLDLLLIELSCYDQIGSFLEIAARSVLTRWQAWKCPYSKSKRQSN